MPRCIVQKIHNADRFIKYQYIYLTIEHIFNEKHLVYDKLIEEIGKLIKHEFLISKFKTVDISSLVSELKRNGALEI